LSRTFVREHQDGWRRAAKKGQPQNGCPGEVEAFAELAA
jgi:hypothetical protein